MRRRKDTKQLNGGIWTGGSMLNSRLNHAGVSPMAVVVAASAVLAVLPERSLLGDTITFQQGTANTFYPGPSGYTLTHDNQILGYGGFETANVGARNSLQL